MAARIHPGSLRGWRHRSGIGGGPGEREVNASRSREFCALRRSGRPLAFEARAENLVIAGTLRQSSIALNHARAFLAAKVGELRRRDWARCSNSTNHNRIQWRKTGASIEALASTPRNAQGLGAFRLALLDEGADWTPSTSQQMFDAISTGLGKMAQSRASRPSARSPPAATTGSPGC